MERYTRNEKFQILANLYDGPGLSLNFIGNTQIATGIKRVSRVVCWICLQKKGQGWCEVSRLRRPSKVLLPVAREVSLLNKILLSVVELTSVEKSEDFKFNFMIKLHTFSPHHFSSAFELIQV